MREPGRAEDRDLSIPVKGSFSAQMINRAYYLVPNLRRNHDAIQAFLDQAPSPP